MAPEPGLGMERTGLAWLANAAGAGASVPWVSLVLMAGALVLLALAVAQWQRRAGARDHRPSAGDAGGPGDHAGARADVETLVRELVAELDARADRLERLIAEADRRLTRPGRPEPEVKPERSTGPARRSEGDPMARRIYGLADEGLPTVEIARQLEQPTGKVELILALRGR